jgi:hypothetical protein
MTNDTNIDFPYDDLDTTHDPDPLRHYSPEWRERFEAETQRQLALVAAWRSVSPELRERAIQRGWFRRRSTTST